MTDDQATEKAVELYKQTRHLDFAGFRNALAVTVSRIEATADELEAAKSIPTKVLKIAQANAQASDEQQAAGQAILDGFPEGASPSDIKAILDKMNGLRPRPVAQRPVGM